MELCLNHFCETMNVEAGRNQRPVQCLSGRAGLALLIGTQHPDQLRDAAARGICCVLRHGPSFLGKTRR
jgi:hypothetical protein